MVAALRGSRRARRAPACWSGQRHARHDRRRTARMAGRRWHASCCAITRPPRADRRAGPAGSTSGNAAAGASSCGWNALTRRRYFAWLGDASRRLRAERGLAVASEHDRWRRHASAAAALACRARPRSCSSVRAGTRHVVRDARPRRQVCGSSARVTWARRWCALLADLRCSDDLDRLAAELLPPCLPDGVTPKVCAAPAELVAAAPAGTCFVVMTHDHALDYELCRVILARADAGWLGLIGSASKAARFRSRLLREGLGRETVSRTGVSHRRTRHLEQIARRHRHCDRGTAAAAGSAQAAARRELGRAARDGRARLCRRLQLLRPGAPQGPMNAVTSGRHTGLHAVPDILMSAFASNAWACSAAGCTSSPASPGSAPRSISSGSTITCCLRRIRDWFARESPASCGPCTAAASTTHRNIASHLRSCRRPCTGSTGKRTPRGSPGFSCCAFYTTAQAEIYLIDVASPH